MNESENEEFILEETSYKITPEGSSFLNCTPSILGPQYDRFLSLDFSQMRIEEIHVVYDRNPYEGANVPRLILKICSRGIDQDTVFYMYCRMGSLLDNYWFEKKHLPDMNGFTPFSESYNAMEISFYSNYSPQYQSGVLDSTIKFKDRSGNCITIECLDFKFKFED